MQKGKQKIFSEEIECQRIKEAMETGQPTTKQRTKEVQQTTDAILQFNRLHNLGRMVARGEFQQKAHDERRTKSGADRPSAQPETPPQPIFSKHLEDVLPEHNRLSGELPYPKLEIQVEEQMNAEYIQVPYQIEEPEVGIPVVEPITIIEETPVINVELPQVSISTTKVIPIPPTFIAPTVRPIKEHLQKLISSRPQLLHPLPSDLTFKCGMKQCKIFCPM